MFQFLSYRDEYRIRVSGIAEEPGQSHNHLRHLAGSVYLRHTLNHIQRIVEKMGINLRLQRLDRLPLFPSVPQNRPGLQAVNLPRHAIKRIA